MADVVSQLASFPTRRNLSAKEYDRQAKELVRNCEKLPQSTWLKQVNKQNILDVLNPSINTLPHLFALYTQCVNCGTDRSSIEACVNYALVFCASFDPIQARYAGSVFRSLLEWLLSTASGDDASKSTAVVTAMGRLDPSLGTFTTTHLHLLRCCLHAGEPSQALPILDRDIYALPQKTVRNLPDDNINDEQDLSNAFITAESGFSMHVKIESLLEYYLLGAHIYTGLRNYGRARIFLEHILLTQSTGYTFSALQIEAYKRWILIGLLARGTRYPLPRTSDSHAVKGITAASKAYEAIADDFERRDWRKFNAEVDVGKQIWLDDGNQPLVKAVADALLEFRVMDLQRTYAAVPVSRVAAHLEMSPEESSQLLTDIIDRGHINASFTPSSGGVLKDAIFRFHTSSPAKLKTTEQSMDLESQIKRIQNLAAFLQDADRRLQLSKEYIEYQRRQKRGQAGSEGDLADQMDLTWDAQTEGPNDENEDEDIMGM